MDRRAFLGTLTVGLLAAPLAAEAQQPGKVWRIGVLADARPPSSDERVQATGFTGVFRSSLRDLGYVEGRNLAIGGRRGRGPDDLPRRARLGPSRGSWPLGRFGRRRTSAFMTEILKSA